MDASNQTPDPVERVVKKMTISRKAARALCTRAKNAARKGDFITADQAVKALNEHGAWWSARAACTFINRLKDSDLNELAKRGIDVLGT